MRGPNLELVRSAMLDGLFIDSLAIVNGSLTKKLGKASLQLALKFEQKWGRAGI